MHKFNLKTLLFLIGGTFAASFVCILGLTLATQIVGYPAWRQDIKLNSYSEQNTFSADGQTVITATPDQAVINLGISLTDTSVATVQEQANTIANNLQSQLQSFGVEAQDIQTTDYSLYPNYDYENNRAITGYTLSNTIQVTITDFDLLNQIIDTATTLGINEVSGINFTLSHEKEAELKDQARQEAITEAKENATTLANLAGITLGPIINVYEFEPTTVSPNYTSNYNLRAEDAGMALESAPTSVSAGSSTYTYQVTLTYQTY